jgi:hypothetical protein
MERLGSPSPSLFLSASPPGDWLVIWLLTVPLPFLEPVGQK